LLLLYLGGIVVVAVIGNAEFHSHFNGGGIVVFSLKFWNERSEFLLLNSLYLFGVI